MTKSEGIAKLEGAKALLAVAVTKEQTIEILALAGKAVGYKPAFRCLVEGNTPKDSIFWKE